MLAFSRKASLTLLLAAASVPALTAPALAAQQGQGFEAATPTMKARAPQGASPSLKPQLNRPLLPPAFAGEPRVGDIVSIADPNVADAAHAAVLKEDGLQQSSIAHYGGTGAVGWTVQALRFGDATGAYSAWTFYRDPTMEPAAVGENAAASASLFLMRSRATLVLARAAGLGVAAAGQPSADQDARKLKFAMLGLLEGLPALEGPDAVAPSLPGLLPDEGLQANSIHYAVGPASYNGPLPVSSIDFGRSAEVATARYRFRSGSFGVLTLEMLPTPQIAGAALRGVQALPDGTLHAGTLRTGPLVAIVSGAGVSAADAQRLLNQIHYVADLTMDQPQGYTSEVAKAAKLLLGIAYLTGILAAAALLLALFLGGGRVLLRRLQGKPDSSLHDEEFISLHL